uniref:Fucolectin tachylectin-4 pentraxin-1 domain-containing protein n=1 Tax=Gadus morhua TaxID=8049 RepID=A0A8C5CQZ5_GADMO
MTFSPLDVPDQLISSQSTAVPHLPMKIMETSASSIAVPLRGAAVQSSTASGWTAGRAIDGSCSSGTDSCTHTSEMDNPWWRLQLDGVYRVSVIEITNRNVARDRLDGVEIHIGNSLVNNGNDNPRCAIIHDVPDSLTQTVHCWGMEGMYVNFYKPFNTTALTLCEVKVYGGRNPFYQSKSSLVGAAVQSSTYLGWIAGQAIDGSCSPDGKDRCSYTGQMDNPWWRLQLDGVYRVSVIEITNMYSTRKWLDGVEIHIGNSLVNNGNDNPRCAIIHDVPDGLTQTVHCWGMEGVYVNFYKPFNTTYLMLCEVKVYGGRNPFYQSKSSLVWGWVYECDIWLG